jgi:hypothetical protein
MRITHLIASIALPAVALCAVAAATPAAAATAGWQSPSTFDIPTGQVNQQISYNCPTTIPVAHIGSFAFNSVGQASDVFLTFNGPRFDIPSKAQWAWHFFWPAGAPAGVSVILNVYCAKT